KQTLEMASEFHPGQSVVSFNIGNIRKDMALQFSENWGPLSVKAFSTVNDYETAEGHFRVEAVGIAAQVKKDWEINEGFQIGVQANGAGGYLNFDSPTVAGSYNELNGSWSRNSWFYMAKANLHARWNKVTAQIEYDINSIDYKTMEDSSEPYMGANVSV